MMRHQQKRLWTGIAVFSLLVGLSLFALQQNAGAEQSGKKTSGQAAEVPPGAARAIFAGGCFWCMEPPFDKLDGVYSTTSGYTGGKSDNPTYREVTAGTTGHTEAVEVVYDPNKVSYEKLLDVFWVNIDPTQSDRQFCDRGSQYRPGIFPVDSAQRQAAETSRDALSKNKPFKGPIRVEITDASRFYAAEEYHQDYYQKNPLRYKLYRTGCRRDARLKELWGDRATTD